MLPIDRGLLVLTKYAKTAGGGATFHLLAEEIEAVDARVAGYTIVCMKSGNRFYVTENAGEIIEAWMAGRKVGPWGSR